VLLHVLLLSIANAKPIPSISNQFFLKTIEIDDTHNGSVFVRQTIIEGLSDYDTGAEHGG
jgi:hypothetical protein